MNEIEIYTKANGEAPYEKWMAGLDMKTQQRIDARINRIRLGNLGDSEAVGGGVLELRFHFGPGYRVYTARVGQTVILLLCGGDKSSQKADIKEAMEYLEDYKRQKHQ